ncbi:unnamed protein product [Rotaria socialis]|uniref:Golgi apparatus protein 1 n=1 Tax=Rotaria socialis TaxID=392032 RepID=A0A818J273_9BILA|nr:unnamed protein product [Rotaria socialis]CAF4481106.1 unnamed protein product [Rotaria socialis]
MVSNPMIFTFVLILSVGIFKQTVQADTQRSNSNGIRRTHRAADERILLSASATLLASSIECKADVQKYCAKGTARAVINLKVLQCFDDLDNAVNLISKECQNRIYKFKYNMTHDVRFDDGAIKYCAKDIKYLDECNDRTDERGTGRLVSCLYDRLGNITEPSCRNFINQLQSVIFTDWRLSEYFTTACFKDITDLKCGRLDDDNDTLPHNQGAVIACLSRNNDGLSKPCLKHISRLHEMQSNDYHLDRALYYACRDDRERLCTQVSSGNGRVYRCLYDNKFNTMMSADCRKEVHRRQKMVATNALLDAPLVRACGTEMREHECVANPKDPDPQLSLINLLLCLEDRIKKGNNIKDDCRREVLMHRRMLMSDYAVSPEIVAQCKNEMVQHCASLYQQGASGTIDQRGGRMIHCLLGAARKEKTFSPACLSSVKTLVRAVDPGNDIRADPLLETACRSVIDTLCARIKPGDSNVVLCLMDNLKNSRMTEECEDRLMEVAYFMSRDWRLTPKLMRSCQKDLIKLCELPPNWSMTSNMSDVSLGQYLSCLYRHKKELDNECRNEFQKIMRTRTTSIGLMPEIEDKCIEDLASCKNPEIKGEEMKCLQKKYKSLEDSCKTAVKAFTKMTITDPSLDFLLMKTCDPMIQLFCANIGTGHENDLLRCLINNKNNQKMDFRCKTSIEHHQIISLKDKAFLSEQFQKKCEKELTEHCPGKKTKSGTIQCLAGIVLQDVLKKTTRINEECRSELKFELLQRSENINFDPLLAIACKNDISKFCADRTAGNAQVIDCLKANHKKVSEACYAKLKKREKIDIVLPGADYSLTTKCAPLIQKYCATANKQNLLSCLRRNINQDNTPVPCRTVLYRRLMILNTDGRFHKGLIENCQTDIDKHCQNLIIDEDNDDEESDDADDKNKNDKNPTDDDVQDRDMGGRIIGCLRSKYANTQAELEPKCIVELVDVIQTSKLDIEFDVKLYQSCKNIINSQCSGSEKEDCLKLLYQRNKITEANCKQEIIRIIREGRADVHVDPALSTACQVDILKYCNDVPIGSGKQLNCLIQMSKSVTPYCKSMLLKRQELWDSISRIDDLEDLTREISKSTNNVYLYAAIISILFVIFLAGCCSRRCIRVRRVQKYQ